LTLCPLSLPCQPLSNLPQLTMAEGEINIDNIIQRLLEGKYHIRDEIYKGHIVTGIFLQETQ
jgi:hypothetical protein